MALSRKVGLGHSEGSLILIAGIPINSPPETRIQVDEIGPQNFALTVIFDGQRFACGTYLNRASAMQAGRLFVERKQGEQAGRKKRPRGKR
jgi:hypothetical protein